jgi:predicted negative regulator of RcsB-dependent stress response
LTEYMTDEEQIQLLKNWIKQYSGVILAGVLIAVIAMTGWRYWQQRQANILNHASAVYDEMLTDRAQNDVANTKIQADKLFAHYASTTYGQMAAFMLARSAVLNKNTNAAIKQLNWALDHSNTPAFRQLARIRLARLLIADKKPKEAINTLDTIDDDSFDGLTNEVKGDAYFALHDIAKARAAYGKALKKLPRAESIRPLLQMKYDNLATLNQTS